MDMRTAIRGSVVLAMLVAGVASAQTQPTVTSPAGQWTVESGQTVGEGSNVLRGQVGWPGIWFDFIHGVDPTFDIGGRFGFNYGFQGLTNGSNGVGLIFQALLRKQITDLGGFKLALTFDPGFLLYFPSGGTIAGITFPIAAQMGFPVADKVVINASFGIPMYVIFSPGNFYIPILFGGGVEYLLQPNLALTFDLKIGPTIATAGGSAFTLYTMLGVAYKL
jgi:hypothetical protein